MFFHHSLRLKFSPGLGMYETPLFLAHEEESGGRSVPTTPLQVAAPGGWQTDGDILFHW